MRAVFALLLRFNGKAPCLLTAVLLPPRMCGLPCTQDGARLG